MNRPLFWLHGNPVTPIELMLAIAALVLVGLAVARLRRAAAKLMLAEGETRATMAAVMAIPVWLVVAIGGLLALDFLKVHLPSAAVFAGLLSIAAAAAFQPVMSAVASGFLLRLERPFAVGDRITVGKIEGDVKVIKLLSIVLRTPANALVAIPNSQLMSEPIVNWSTGDRKLRLRIPVVVAHGTDLKKASTVLQRAAESSARVVKSPAPRVLLARGDRSGHCFEIWAWISGPGDRAWARNELYRAIDGELRKAHIRVAGGKPSSTNTPRPEVTPESVEPHPRDSRGGRERKRREDHERQDMATVSRTEPMPEATPVEHELPLQPEARELNSDARTSTASEPSEEKPQTYGRSKRRTPRR